MELREAERRIIIAMKKMSVSKGKKPKHVRRETIKKKIPDRYVGEFNNALDSLQKKGVIGQVKKRPETYAFTKEGFKIAMKIYDEWIEETYKGLRILLTLIGL